MATAQDASPDPRKATAPLSDFPAMQMPPASPSGTLADAPRVQNLYDDALEAFEDGNPRNAIVKLDEALATADKDYYEVFQLMAEAKFRMERFGEARTAAEFAARLRPGSADSHYLLGRLYRRRKDFEQAIGHFRTATLAADREVNNVNVTASFFELGECLVEAGYPLAAAQSFQAFDERLWDSYPEQREDKRITPVLAEYPRGMIGVRMELLKQLGRRDDRVRAAQWAAQSRPDDAYLARIYLQALLDAGRFDEAFAACRKALDSTSGDDALVRLAVKAARGAKTLDPWVGTLAASITPEQDNSLPLAVAKRLDQVGAAAQALQLWRPLAKARPHDPARAWALAASLRAAGQLPETVRTLADFVRTNPDSTEVPRSQFSAWMRRFDAADDLLTLIDSLRGEGKSDFATDFILGSLAAAAGHDALAEKLLSACLKERPTFVPARVNWGEMLLNSYRWEDARTQAAAALKDSPKYAAAHFLMARALSGLDENDAAEESFEATLNIAPKESAYALAFAHHHWRLYEWFRVQSGVMQSQGDPRSALELARIAQRHLLGAQRYYREAATNDPNSAAVAEGLVSSYLWGGKTDIARSRLVDAEEAGLPDGALWRMRKLIENFRRLNSVEYLRELEQRFGSHPDEIASGRRLAELYESRLQVDDAFGVMSRLRKTAPDDPDLIRLAARIDIRRYDYDRAAPLLEQLVRRFPNRGSALSELAALYHNDLRMDSARALLSHLLELDLQAGQERQFRRAMLETWYQLGDFDAALVYLDKWMADEPDREDVFRERINALQLAGRNDEAVRTTHEWVEAAPDDAQRNARLVTYAAVCSAAGKHKLAESAKRELIKARPAAPQLVRWLAETLLDDDRPDDALAALDELLPQATGANFELQWFRAQCEAQAGRVDAAVSKLKSMLTDPALLASRPNLRATRQRLIVTLSNAKRFDEAIDLCDQWSAKTDDQDAAGSIALLDLKRITFQSADRTEDYLKVMQQLHTRAPFDTGVNNDLGYTWIDRGEHLEKAVKMIRAAVAAEPLNSSFLDSLGWAYYKTGDFSLARKYLRRSLRVLRGEDPVVRDHLADADYRLGDVESARKNWQKSLDLIAAEKPDPPQAGRAELTASLRNKLKAAEKGNKPPLAPVGDGQ